jgi:hypothetical protein
MRSLLLVSALAACGAPTNEPVQHLPKVDDSFTLFVSNQSFEMETIDIRVEIDDQLAVSGDFEVGSQHTWLRFDLGLTPGQHRMRVTTSDVADVALDRTFEMTDRKFGVVSFWYYPAGSPEPTPPQFSLQILDEQPYFE